MTLRRKDAVELLVSLENVCYEIDEEPTSPLTDRIDRNSKMGQFVNFTQKEDNELKTILLRLNRTRMS